MKGLQHSPHTLEKVRISEFMLLTLKSFETVFLFFLKIVSGHSHFVQKDLLLRKVPSIYVEKTIKNIILFNIPPPLSVRALSSVEASRSDALIVLFPFCISSESFEEHRHYLHSEIFALKWYQRMTLSVLCKDPFSGSGWQLVQEWGLNAVNLLPVLEISQQIEH